MKRSLRNGAISALVAAAILVPATTAFAYTSVRFQNGPQSAGSIASSSSWRTTVGGEININLTAAFGMQFGKSHVDTITTAGVQFVAESNGVGTAMNHASRGNAWNRCYWVYINGQSGQGSPSSQCWARVP